jgi:hypothetical protein
MTEERERRRVTIAKRRNENSTAHPVVQRGERATPLSHGPAHLQSDRVMGRSDRETDSVSESDSDEGGGGAKEVWVAAGRRRCVEQRINTGGGGHGSKLGVRVLVGIHHRG